ncbi:MAG: M28 family peptidase [Thermoanaerobaculia bacterium]|nr:M28 family peptidase [Thermoanaerobaculia bacterium]
MLPRLVSARGPLLTSLVGGAALAALLSATNPDGLPAEVRKTAEGLRDRAIAGTRATEWVRGLTDTAGHRMPGSPGDRIAVEWASATLRAHGFSNVRAEKVTVQVWRRGIETGEVTAPHRHRLVLTALGGSVATPEGGLEAEILELPNLEALDTVGEKARGKIVFFNKRMERRSDGAGYVRAVDVRGHGASRAAKHGAVGVLIRSVGTDDTRNPHTGGMRYEAEVPKVPAAALSAPDADLLERLGREGKPVRVRFHLTCGDAPPAQSANVIGEIRGRESPREIVLLAAHLDSWDMGTGAVDDGAGCGIVIEAARLIGQLPRPPRRTVRVVLFANEEHGLDGGKAYRKDHAGELAQHVAALEADSGTGAPLGMSWNAGDVSESVIKEIAALLEPVGVSTLSPESFGGADIYALKQDGVPLFSFQQDMLRYFDLHHTDNDTFDKIEPHSMDRMVAAVAAFAYCAASVPRPFERIPEDRRKITPF